MYYFDERKKTANRPEPSDIDVQLRKDRAHARMLYGLGFIAAFAITYISSRTLQFNCGPLNSLLTFAFLLMPCAAFWVFLFGPWSWLKKIGLCLTVPLSAISIALVLLAEYSDGCLEFAYDSIIHGGIPDEVLRTYRDSGSGEVLCYGKILGNDLRLLRWSIGGFSSFQYRLELTHPIGNYCYELLKSEELPPGRIPKLITRRDGGYDLQVDDRSGREIFRADAMSMLDRKSIVPRE